MGDQNVFISNGTCYSGAGKKLGDGFIPCGNDAFGRQTCCGAGDTCLADNACFGKHGEGYGSLLTYVAGCSDPDYKDKSCPKKYWDQPWEALTRCDDDQSVWAPCSQAGSPSTLQNGAYCSCTEAAKTTTAFRDSPTLASSCSLPQSAGQSIQFYAGYFPSGSPGGGSNGNNGSPGSGGSGPAQTGASGSSQGGPTGGDGGSGAGLTSGAKIGIGVGVALGALILLAAIVAFIFTRRKRRRSQSEIESTAAGGAKDTKPTNPRTSAISATPTMSEAGGPAISEADGKPARPWSMRSELEGSVVAPSLGESSLGDHEHIRKSGELSPVAELPGSEPVRDGGNGMAQERLAPPRA